VRTNIKNARPNTVANAIKALGAVLERGELEDYFGKGVVLIPAPRSSPLQAGWLWPAETICRAMVEAGLGREILPCIRRVQKVPKSAFAKWGERPTAEMHLASMEVDAPSLLKPRRVTIVDDVVTRGSTLLACASLVQQALPTTEVRVFGVIRTRGLQPEIERIVDPCEGEILWNGYSVDRAP
jgi:predicted amidophosphoribosyltransferase